MATNMTTLFAKQVVWSSSFLNKPLDKKKIITPKVQLKVYFILLFFPSFSSHHPWHQMTSSRMSWAEFAARHGLGCSTNIHFIHSGPPKGPEFFFFLLGGNC